ncbi:hypothetical protein Sru01_65580 [Sphaerisporangium rufum]|uniref:Uncharacterized protein n=1 Tax=Sphaerisporangium rufum TaxID=1381558 RepID=A0A919R8F9_9ACTN|nr:hypothetical protein [Sphaerisporangium rufum]GII81576.1 hypothetical protein Sru01_65580 [Sphaerisporangium rufum]
MAFHRSRRSVLDDQGNLTRDGRARFIELAKQYGASEQARSRAFAIAMIPNAAIGLVGPFVVGNRLFGLGFVGTLGCLYIALAIPAAMYFAVIVRTFKGLAALLTLPVAMFTIGLALFALAWPGHGASMIQSFPWMEVGITSLSIYGSMLLGALISGPILLMAEIRITRRWPEAMALRQILWALETMSETPYLGPDERQRLSQIFGRISNLIGLHLPATLPSFHQAGRDMLRSRCRLAARAVQEYEIDAILATGVTRVTLQENLRKLATVIVCADYGHLPLPKNETHITTKGVLKFLVRILRLVCVGLLVPAAVWATGQLPMPAWWDAYRDGATVFAIAWVVATIFVMLNPHYKDPLQVAQEFLSMINPNRRSE